MYKILYSTKIAEISENILGAHVERTDKLWQIFATQPIRNRIDIGDIIWTTPFSSHQN